MSQTRLFRLGNRVALPYRRRSALIWGAVAVLIFSLAVATLMLGDLGLGPHDLLELARGEASTTTQFVLERVRGPRVLIAILAGGAFGLSGALFQNVTRNPLGSPDVLGLAAGAGTGVALTALFPIGIPTPIGALAGAGIAIGLVTLATGSGLSSTSRVIIAGIAVAAMATAVTQFVVTATLRDEASRLAAYLVGSLNSRDMGQVGIIAATLVLAVPVLLWLSPRLHLMELGDELTTSLGGRAPATRTQAILLSVLLAAMAVAVAGPIAFVALMSPHAARMLTCTAGPNLLGSALIGALLLVVADLAVQQVPFLDGLPAGVITAGFGGVFLGYLLVTAFQKGQA
ncbi:iron chelate uptake ABC transporter family permease subunit [Yaniella flava]|uniref:Iron chelate uptake ABC transporter family permease subunit n=1 Tax=Yaniella flava TaxID=287930 RepID=A0ABP5G8L6_9MICC